MGPRLVTKPLIAITILVDLRWFGELGAGNHLGFPVTKGGPTIVRGQYCGAASAVGTWASPPIIKAFGCEDTTYGNTGTFWIGKRLGCRHRFRQAPGE